MVERVAERRFIWDERRMGLDGYFVILSLVPFGFQTVRVFLMIFFPIAPHP
jgi:hypothetical protein